MGGNFRYPAPYGDQAVFPEGSRDESDAQPPPISEPPPSQPWSQVS